MKILKESETKTFTEFSLFFVWEDDPNAGFSFPCDEDGNLLDDGMSELGKENFRKCQDGTFDVRSEGIQKREDTYQEPAIGECACGEKIVLGSFTNTCERCGRDYNWSGQELAPRCQWGEETGETATDILMGGNPFSE